MVLNDSKPWTVNCKAVGQPGINHLTITGTCSVFLVSVPITADVKYDPKSGRYSGTYVGGDMSAQISGQTSGAGRPSAAGCRNPRIGAYASL